MSGTSEGHSVLGLPGPPATARLALTLWFWFELAFGHHLSLRERSNNSTGVREAFTHFRPVASGQAGFTIPPCLLSHAIPAPDS